MGKKTGIVASDRREYQRKYQRQRRANAAARAAENQAQLESYHQAPGKKARQSDRYRSDDYRAKGKATTTARIAALRKLQGGSCAICGKEIMPQSDDYNTRECIDHDHETGRVRGLLCHQCNAGIGFFYDDVDRLLSAVAYLENGGSATEEEIEGASGQLSLFT